MILKVLGRVILLSSTARNLDPILLAKRLDVLEKRLDFLLEDYSLMVKNIRPMFEEWRQRKKMEVEEKSRVMYG